MGERLRIMLALNFCNVTESLWKRRGAESLWKSRYALSALCRESGASSQTESHRTSLKQYRYHAPRFHSFGVVVSTHLSGCNLLDVILQYVSRRASIHDLSNVGIDCYNHVPQSWVDSDNSFVSKIQVQYTAVEKCDTVWEVVPVLG
jgi:hypothetical protein